MIEPASSARRRIDAQEILIESRAQLEDEMKTFIRRITPECAQQLAQGFGLDLHAAVSHSIGGERVADVRLDCWFHAPPRPR